MAVFKCKMCGGTLNIENGATVAECEFCGRKQTIPKLDDEKRANLYDRANHFRRTNDYDKAMGIYEIILNEDKTDAEAYWSILLCKYGVEYVKDPATHKRVSTINRTQFTSILKDIDYKNALKYADGYQRDIYEEEAKEIDKIQKGILAISGKEEPFDVFICYKETDHSGRRTIDSVLAQDLYHNLKNEGLKVFFSRITLEDKLGVAYEPYIFAALNSAKVMVVIGSKLEYFNAVWVKNEWSRYLSLIRNGEKKTLIPAYKDIDPYDLPEEFTHLQAQDMNKLGFMQDLVYGIKKIIGRTTPKTVVKETVVVDNHHDTAPLLRRAYLFLEDGDFDSANEYAEKVLDSNPECAEAYFIKLLAEVGIRKPELLLQSETVISEYSNYKKALRFADNKFGEELSNYNDAILDNIENSRKENIYQSGCELLEDARYLEAIETFEEIIDYKDSASKIEKCNDLIETERKEMVYNNAISRVSMSNASDVALKQSISELQSISGYKNADGKVAELQARLEKYYHDKRVAEEQAKIRAEEERLRKLREAELRKIKIEKRKQKLKKTAKIGVPSILALTLILVLTFTLFIPLGKYNKANDLLNSGNYEEAIKIYEDLGGFSGSETKIVVIKAVQTIENGSFEQGIKDALNAGAKVNLTYEFAGGNFVEGQSSEGVSPMSCTLYTKETPEAEKTYTYTKIEDFSGLKIPEKSGYYFQKWELVSCNAEVTSKDNTLNLRLVAIWSANKYTITYDLDGGSVSSPNPIGYNPDDDTFTLINPTRIGYTFIGWTGTDLEEKTMTVIIVSGSYGNRSYTANWQANTYTITYDANGGIASKTQDVATYDVEFILATAERTGYTFLGWYVGNNEYKDFDCYNLLTGLDLIAKWQINTYAITYNLNGGTATNEATFTVEDALTITAPTKMGYTFDGWMGTDIDDITKTLTISKGTIGNREYTANWTAKTYTVTYNGNGGTPSKTSDTATYDEYLTLATAERRGYKFDGWKEDNKIYTSGDWKTDKSVILVAQWSIIKYNITYNLDGGSATNVATYTVNDTITLNNPTRAGYTFTGWTYSGQTTPTKTVSFSNEIGNKTFTANWQANLNTIIFNANSGVGEMQPQKIYTDSRENLTTNLFVKSGYTFMGWATSASGSVAYYDGANYKMGANSVYNLYAIWSRDTYTVGYNLNGGTATSPTTYNVDTDTFTLNNPTRDGYEFIGWTGTDLTDYTMSVTIPKGSVGNRSYTANWQTTIVLHSNNGLNEQVSQRFINTNTGNINANTFTNGDYIFNGWSTAVNGEVVYLDLASITLNQAYTDLYAVWGGTVGLEYVQSELGMEIWGYSGESKDVYIADKYRGINVVSIREEAFAEKASLESITIGSSISNIGAYAFKNVTAEIIWDNPTIAEFGAEAFAQYKGYNIEIPSTVTTIGSYAFKNASAEIIWVNPTIKQIGENAFSWYGGDSLEIPTSVTVIHDKVFEYCVDVSKVYYNAKNCYLSSMYNGGFNDLGRHKDVTVYIGCEVEIIPARMFFNCSKIKEVVFEENSSCLTIGKSAFAGCSSLENINIPSSITTLEEGSFRYCSTLKEFAVPTCSYLDYYFKNAATNLPNNYFVPESLRYLKIWGGETLNLANYENVSLDTIELPDSIKKIVLSEGFSADNIVFNGTIEQWCNIEFYYGVNSLNSSMISHQPYDLYIDGEKVEELIIPESINSVSMHAFGNCKSLTQVIIHNNIEEIGNYAFSGCNSLTTIYYKGTQEEWSNISIGSFSFVLDSVTRYYYGETEPELNAEGTAYDGNYWHFVDNVPTIWVYTPEE